MEYTSTTTKIMPNLYTYPEILVFTNLQNVYKVQNKNFSSQLQILSSIEFEADEKPIYFAGTKNYEGFLICVFQNGKVAKISLDAYKTDYIRRKLIKAFNNESPLIFIEIIENDLDLYLKSDILKVMMFNTSLVNPVGSKNAKGVHAMKSKHNSKVISVKKENQINIQDQEYYRKGLNVIGFYLKEGDFI